MSTSKNGTSENGVDVDLLISFRLIYSLKGYLTVILDPVNLGNSARRTALAKHLPVEVPE